MSLSNYNDEITLLRANPSAGMYVYSGGAAAIEGMSPLNIEQLNKKKQEAFNILSKIFNFEGDITSTGFVIRQNMESFVHIYNDTPISNKASYDEELDTFLEKIKIRLKKEPVILYRPKDNRYDTNTRTYTMNELFDILLTIDEFKKMAETEGLVPAAHAAAPAQTEVKQGGRRRSRSANSKKHRRASGSKHSIRSHRK